MRNNNLLALIASVSLLTAGCAGREQKLVGKWDATDVKAPSTPIPADQLKKGLGQVFLELKPDRHFEFPGEDGTWSIKDDKIILSVQHRYGKPVEDFIAEMKKQFPSTSQKQAQEALFESMRTHTATLSANDTTIELPFRLPIGSDLTLTFKKAQK